jgi:hypothetical protein
MVTDEMSVRYPDKNRLAGAIRAGYAEAGETPYLMPAT